MKAVSIFAAAVLAAITSPAAAQNSNAIELGEVVVTANRQNARFAQQDRPFVGLKRQADSALTNIAFSSDSRDEATRKREIHTMILAALDRASAAGMEIVTGNFELSPVTKANYQELPLYNAGRVDTSKADVMIKTRLGGSANAAEERMKAFVKALPRSGRGAIDRTGGLSLTIINPDQYRETIIKLVAEDARRNAATFGPDYGVQINGMDGQVNWSQVSGSEVFLYLPYRYTIVPK